MKIVGPVTFDESRRELHAATEDGTPVVIDQAAFHQFAQAIMSSGGDMALERPAGFWRAKGYGVSPSAQSLVFSFLLQDGQQIDIQVGSRVADPAALEAAASTIRDTIAALVRLN